MTTPAANVRATIIPSLRYRNALAAIDWLCRGAVIVDKLETKDYGGKGYSCRDFEGHLWWFGEYDPWAAGTHTS